jgi:hypothetical protein
MELRKSLGWTLKPPSKYIRKLLGMTELSPSSRGVDFIEYLLCDSPNVDVALTWNANKQKAPRDARPKALVLFGKVGCGGRI